MGVYFLPLSAAIALRQWDYYRPVQLIAFEIPQMHGAGYSLRKVQVVHEERFAKEQTCYGIDIETEAIQPEDSRDAVDRQLRDQNKLPGHTDHMDKAVQQKCMDYC